MVVLGVIALLVIGPKQLPELARTLGRIINDFKRATGDLGSSFTSVKRETDQTFAEMQRSLRASIEQAKLLEEDKSQAHSAAHGLLENDIAGDSHLDDHFAHHAAEPEQLELDLSRQNSVDQQHLPSKKSSSNG